MKNWNFVHTIERAAALPDTYSILLSGHTLYVYAKQYREGINIIVTDIVNRSSITLNQQQTTLLKDNLRSPYSSRHHWHTWRHYWASSTCMRSSGSRPIDLTQATRMELCTPCYSRFMISCTNCTLYTTIIIVTTVLNAVVLCPQNSRRTLLLQYFKHMSDSNVQCAIGTRNCEVQVWVRPSLLPIQSTWSNRHGTAMATKMELLSVLECAP